MDQCPFCYYELDKTQNVVFQNDFCVFLQKPQEVLIGSGIIVPKAHKESVFDLSLEEWISTYDLLKVVKAYLDESYKPNGYNIGWNVGYVGGQEIFHAHLHVIPRYSDEPQAGKGIRHHLKQLTNKRN